MIYKITSLDICLNLGRVGPWATVSDFAADPQKYWETQRMRFAAGRTELSQFWHWSCGEAVAETYHEIPRAIKKNIGEKHVFTWGNLRYSRCGKSQLQNNNCREIPFLKGKAYMTLYNKHSGRKYTNVNSTYLRVLGIYSHSFFHNSLHFPIHLQWLQISRAIKNKIF